MSAIYQTIACSYSGYTALQTAGKYVETKNPQMYALAKKINDIFLCIDFAAIGITGVQLLWELRKKYPVFIAMVLNDPTCYLLTLSAFAWVALGIPIVYGINSSVCRKKNLNDLLDGKLDENITKKINVQRDRPLNEKFEQYILVNKLIISIAMQIFSGFSYFHLINSIFQVASLMFLTKHKWLKYDIEFPIAKWEMDSSENTITINNDTLAFYIDKIRVSYLSLMIPAKNNEKCSVCIDDSEQKKYYFCSDAKHSLHDNCIIGLIYGKSKNFLENSSIERQETQYTDGKRVIHYPITISKKNFPTCPSCRQKPFYEKITIHVHEDFREYEARITLTE